MTRFDIVLNFAMIGLGLGPILGAIAGGLAFIVILIIESELSLFPFIVGAVGFGIFIGLVMGSIEGLILGLITAFCFHKTIPRYYLATIMLIAVILTFILLWGWGLKFPNAPLSPMVVAFPAAIFGAWCLGQSHIDTIKV